MNEIRKDPKAESPEVMSVHKKIEIWIKNENWTTRRSFKIWAQSRNSNDLRPRRRRSGNQVGKHLPTAPLESCAPCSKGSPIHCITLAYKVCTPLHCIAEQSFPPAKDTFTACTGYWEHLFRAPQPSERPGWWWAGWHTTPGNNFLRLFLHIDLCWSKKLAAVECRSCCT